MEAEQILKEYGLLYKKLDSRVKKMDRFISRVGKENIVIALTRNAFNPPVFIDFSDAEKIGSFNAEDENGKIKREIIWACKLRSS